MITIDINMILSIGAALMGFGSLLFALRANKHWHARCLALEASLAGVRREMEHVASISLRTGRRVKRIENEYSGVSDRVDQVELRGPAQSIDQAIDSARRGSDPVKLTQQFGLSRGEADLVMRLHGRRKSA
jgi:Protein of unknown function (DUF2802)